MNVLNNKLTSKEKSNGWQLLFDGKTTTGWHGYGRDNAGSDWKIEEGVLMLDADTSMKNRKSNDLVTDDEYENFDLKIDWKIGPKGNSGLIFYIHEDSSKYRETYNTGLEMQILDNGTAIHAGHTDARLYTHRAGDLYDLIASKEAIHPQGEWNHAEIISSNGKLDFYLNGMHTLSTTLWNYNWKQMIAISKFKDMPGFGIFKKGKIALQDHGEKVAFKNIKIKRL
ncbi:MAG: DUF1080 domain-containing protein [Ginsengibacter sp.]